MRGALADTLSALVRRTRRTGNSTAIAAAAKATGGVVVCHSLNWAREFERQFEVPTFSIQSADRLRGRVEEIYLDGECMQVLLSMAKGERAAARKALADVEAERDGLRGKMRNAKIELGAVAEDRDWHAKNGEKLQVEVRRLQAEVAVLMARPCIYCGCDHAPDQQRD